MFIIETFKFIESLFFYSLMSIIFLFYRLYSIPTNRFILI